ncbi:MAG: hypothetical protein GY715_08005 [Planctomycetes bacterium]|nr:hypothetical protein [Planctomycetota bacterium]
MAETQAQSPNKLSPGSLRLGGALILVIATGIGVWWVVRSAESTLKGEPGAAITTAEPESSTQALDEVHESEPSQPSETPLTRLDRGAGRSGTDTEEQPAAARPTREVALDEERSAPPDGSGPVKQPRTVARRNPILPPDASDEDLNEYLRHIYNVWSDIWWNARDYRRRTPHPWTIPIPFTGMTKDDVAAGFWPEDPTARRVVREEMQEHLARLEIARSLGGDFEPTWTRIFDRLSNLSEHQLNGFLAEHRLLFGQPRVMAALRRPGEADDSALARWLNASSTD